MNRLFRKVMLLSVVCTAVMMGIVHAQSSSEHDSLRHLLNYFHENTKDEGLKQAIKEAQAIYTGNTINDSLAVKLLDVDSFLIALQSTGQMTVNYIELLSRIFLQLSPLQEHPYYAKSLTYLAILFAETGRYEKALPLHRQALAIYKKVLGEEHPPYATSLNNLASCYRNMGQYEKALPLYQQALAIYKKVLGEAHPDYAFNLHNLAILYGDMGQYEKTLRLHQQALTIVKKVFGEEHPDYARSLNSLAYLYRYMGQYEKALSLYQQALAINKKVLGEEHPEYAFNLHSLAYLFGDMRQYEKALPLYQHALTNYKKVLGEEHPLYANGLNCLANLYVDMGQYEKALHMYLQTLAIKKKMRGEEHPSYALSLNHLGLLYGILGKHADASTLLHKASEVKFHHLNLTYSTLTEQEKINFLDQESDYFFYLPSLLFTQRVKQTSLINQSYINELTLKGMVLENQHHALNNIRKSGDSSILQLYEQWRFNKALMGKQLLLPIKERLRYFDSLQEATNQLEQQLSRLATTFRSQLLQRSITAKDIASRLAKDQAAIEFIRFRLYNPKQTDSILYAALIVLPRDTAARFVPLFEEKQLKRLLQLPADALISDAVKHLYDPKSNGNELYRLIWKPLEQHLTGIHSICYAPTGLLHRVSFGALSPGSAHSLIDQYRLQQVFSTRSLMLPALTPSLPRSASVWGNIDYSSPLFHNSLTSRQQTRGKSSEAYTSTSSFNFYTWDTKNLRGEGEDWEPLPYTKKELDSLTTLLTKAGVPVSIGSGASATEEAFKALDGKSPQLLHLATHGFFLPVAENKPKHGMEQMGGSSFTVQQNPLFRSGLVLAGGNKGWKGEPVKEGKEDGILTAYEIAQMDLTGTDVVVLSACETALGDVQGNEGVIGLQRAFKLAGVKQMIVSLWEVPDEVTMELMTAFYRNWLGGNTCREALRKSQLTIKENYKQPFYWASFVLVE